MVSIVTDIREVVDKMNFKKCGTITCIHNIDGKCAESECIMKERGLRKEED